MIRVWNTGRVLPGLDGAIMYHLGRDLKIGGRGRLPSRVPVLFKNWGKYERGLWGLSQSVLSDPRYSLASAFLHILAKGCQGEKVGGGGGLDSD